MTAVQIFPPLSRKKDRKGVLKQESSRLRNNFFPSPQHTLKQRRTKKSGVLFGLRRKKGEAKCKLCVYPFTSRNVPAAATDFFSLCKKRFAHFAICTHKETYFVCKLRKILFPLSLPFNLSLSLSLSLSLITYLSIYISLFLFPLR